MSSCLNRKACKSKIYCRLSLCIHRCTHQAYAHILDVPYMRIWLRLVSCRLHHLIHKV
nr:MAG TPA: hypothetical protein [Caudoviricetes sp.]